MEVALPVMRDYVPRRIALPVWATNSEIPAGFALYFVLMSNFFAGARS
jgi:hypothetical protein